MKDETVQPESSPPPAASPWAEAAARASPPPAEPPVSEWRRHETLVSVALGMLAGGGAILLVAAIWTMLGR